MYVASGKSPTGIKGLLVNRPDLPPTFTDAFNGFHVPSHGRVGWVWCGRGKVIAFHHATHPVCKRITVAIDQ
jgi:hypothetical protein